MNRLSTEEEDELKWSGEQDWWMGGSSGIRQEPFAVEVRSADMRTVANEEDVSTVRAVVKRVASLLGFSMVNQTKVVTVASELARNTIEHGAGGTVTVQVLDAGGRPGLRLRFQDQGPGIADIDQALKDGFTTGSGMGLGLGGSRRLSDEFRISSSVGKGTVVEVTKWA